MAQVGEVPPTPVADLPLPHNTHSTDSVSSGENQVSSFPNEFAIRSEEALGQRQPGQILSLLAPAVRLDVFTVVLPCINTSILTSLLFPAGTIPTLGALWVFRDRGA